MKKTVMVFGKGIEIESNEWIKGDKHRIYFSEVGSKSGKACWDVIGKTWIPVHTEFGGQFKDRIKEAFGL